MNTVSEKIILQHFHDGPQFGEDWFTFPNLYADMVAKGTNGSHFVEIGSWKGKSAAFMAVEIANSGKNIRFDCVDPWPDQPENPQEYFETFPDLYKTFLDNVAPVRDYINPIRKLSDEAVALYEDNSLDFVFIDGNHDYEFVKKDILNYLPKVKPGGILAGHDWQLPGVVQAVTETLGREVTETCNCWVYVKPVEKIEHFHDGPQFGEDWFTFPSLYADMVAKGSDGSHFVEIGSWKGKSAAFMAVEIANSGKKIKFDCIDPWPDQPEDPEKYFEKFPNLYKTFLDNVAPVKDYINPIRKLSDEAFALYEDNSLDFVFIDGNHDYEFVKKDIANYLPKVKPGGILAGHDILFPGVAQAVAEAFGSDFTTACGCWLYAKPSNLGLGADFSGIAAVEPVPAETHPAGFNYAVANDIFLGMPTLEHVVSQACTASQFKEGHYARMAGEFYQGPTFHRKQWEFIYILRALEQFGLLAPGKTGLGFGCGKEPLAVVMAKHGLNIVVTDIPNAQESSDYWGSNDVMDLFYEGICPIEQYREHVTFRAVDMNNIPNDLGTYDFVWSCCALEHLGSLKAGMDFILNSTQCLKPGGIAVHTTEFNVSSDCDTLESSGLSLYRRKDFLDLQNRILDAGCSVLPMNFYTGDQLEDKHIDLPPYKFDIHLKLMLEKYIITSFGLVLRKN
jgi:predicted O-methyltransferase YrrM/2-polyprenyl-3-methyl-5-hydroxy-6-metoxy-1,4-benzoquinol methylase